MVIYINSLVMFISSKLIIQLLRIYAKDILRKNQIQNCSLRVFFAAILFIIALIKVLCRAHTHTNIYYMILIKYLSNESKANIKNKTEC